MTILLLLLLTTSGVSASCTTLPRRLIHPSPDLLLLSSFCIRHATNLSASSMRIFDNGSCLLYHSCADDTSHSKHEACPLYRRLHLGAESVLLLSTRADRLHDPYKLLTEGSPNTTQLEVGETEKSSDQYRSPLTDHQPTPFSHIRVVLLDSNGSESVSLRFAIEASESVVMGNWFSKENLSHASPWDVNVMKKSTYSRFSMKGNTNIGRKFFIKPIREDGTYWTCANYLAYMAVTTGNNENCHWEMKSNISYVWDIEGVGPGRFKGEERYAAEFRLYGETKTESSKIYVRIE